MNKKKILIGIISSLTIVVIAGIGFSYFKEKQTKEEMYALADKGEIVNLSKDFFTAKEMTVVFNDFNLDLLVSTNHKPPLYALVKLDKLQGITPEKRKLINQNMVDVPLEKGINNISEKEVNKIKEICGKNCFIVKKDDSTIAVASDYKTKKVLEKNKEDIFNKNAQNIVDYLKQDYNVEIRADAGVINFVKGNHVSPEEAQLVINKSKEDSKIKILELKYGIDKMTKKELNKMKDFCGTGCIIHLLDDKKISVISFF